ncbi:MAG: L-seryl-tRNA(Sec) selenium transferase [Gemmatimonadetes bacterium]|nr:MAG: L-seryl-tRNA(Sec) selenium transferase [Gemmatimonadota bacterium]
MSDARRRLPAVSTLLEYEGVRALHAAAPREVIADAVRRSIETARRDPAVGPDSETAWVAAVTAEVDRALERSLRPVINATGVVLHTNLGRAPVAARAIAAAQAVAFGYSNLEYDLAAGSRGSRHGHCARILCELTGAEDAFVVNNCAAALVLALNTLADGREVIISRGELVEIGGSFRVPSIMNKSGATLVEVGTTNRTHLADYQQAIGPRTGAIASVHRSNFVIEGFVASVMPSALAPVAAAAGVPLVHDFGSGLMLDLAAWGLRGEPTASDAVRAGASVVLMSGDKLLGGPQSGIVLGTRAVVGAMRDNPLARALRVDKFTLAALEATLELYRDPAAAVQDIPVLRMLTMPTDAVTARADALCAQLKGRGIDCDVVATEATVGGGAFPASRIPSSAVRLLGGQAGEYDRRLRGGRTPVIGRTVDGHLLLDLRSVTESVDELLCSSVAQALNR